MAAFTSILKSAVAAFAASMLLIVPAFGENSELNSLLDRLKTAEPHDAEQIQTRILEIWRDTGSASLNLLMRRGFAAMDRGDFEAAREHFSALIDHAPEFPEAYNARAIAYFNLGQFGPALADIEQVLARNPQQFGAIGGLALILEQIGQGEAALEAWREVLIINPNAEGAQDAVKRLERLYDGQEI